MSRILWQQHKSYGNKIRDNGGEGIKNIPNLRDVIYGLPFSLVQNMNLKGKYKKEVHKMYLIVNIFLDLVGEIDTKGQFQQ